MTSTSTTTTMMMVIVKVMTKATTTTIARNYLTIEVKDPPVDRKVDDLG